MKTFSEYMTKDIMYNDVSTHIEKTIVEEKLVKQFGRDIKKTLREDKFKHAVVTWRTMLEQTKDHRKLAEDVAIDAGLNKQEFIENLMKIKMIDTNEEK